MPPRKPVKSLFDIAQAATCDLVISSCKNIEERHPCDKSLSFDVVGCEEEVQKLQDLLKESIPLSLWDDVFHATLDHPRRYEICDQRILFSTFIYNNVDVKKLKIGYFIEDTGINAEFFRRGKTPQPIDWIHAHVGYWLKRIPMLSELVELNLMLVENEEIVVAFCLSCKNLVDVNLARCVMTTTFDRMGPCTELRKLTCDKNEPFQRSNGTLMAYAVNQFVNLEEVYFGTSSENLVTTFCRGLFYSTSSECLRRPWKMDRQLNLRTIDLTDTQTEEATPAIIKYFVDLCPRLEYICLDTDSNNYQVIIKMLASSTLKLTKFDFILKYDLEVYREFLSVKGVYITKVEIYVTESAILLEFLRIMIELCPNLAKLSISIYEVTHNWPQSTRAQLKDISFPKLRSLEICNIYSDSLQSILLDHCLNNAENLVTLTLDLFLEDVFIPMVAANEGMKRIKKLELKCHRERVSAKLLRLIYDSCLDLTWLKVKSAHPHTEERCRVLHDVASADNADISIISEGYTQHDFLSPLEGSEDSE